jgi:hypothetical protein
MEGIAVESFLRLGFFMAKDNNREGETTPSPATLRKWFDISTFMWKKKKEGVHWSNISFLIKTHAALVIQRMNDRYRRRRNHTDIIQLYLSF